MIITSNKQPLEWYKREECTALLRRIGQNINVNAPMFDDIPVQPVLGHDRLTGHVALEQTATWLGHELVYQEEKKADAAIEDMADGIDQEVIAEREKQLRHDAKGKDAVPEAVLDLTQEDSDQDSGIAL